MSNRIGERARDNLFHSFAAVEAAAPEIRAAMIPGLASAEGEPAPFARAGGIATALVEMLLDQARRLAEGRGPSDVESLADRHRLLGIEGRHYSRFGDGLAAILRDVIGPRLSSEVTAAWGDAFWFVIRLVMRASQERPGSADAQARHPIVA